MKVNEPGRHKLEKRISCELAKHGKAMTLFLNPGIHGELLILKRIVT